MGLTAPTVLGAFGVAVVALVLFVVAQAKVTHPMLPLDLFGSRAVVITLALGFAFMVGYYGLPFVFSLDFQQLRGLSALSTGALFLPMMLTGAALTAFSARLGERFGRKTLIVAGLAAMALGLIPLGALPGSTPLWVLSALMVLVGLGGPLVASPATAVLLDAVPEQQTRIAAGVFNTSRRAGGALAVAVLGGLLTDPATFLSGMHASLLIAAAVVTRDGTVIRMRAGDTV